MTSDFHFQRLSVWSHSSENANLPVNSVLGGQVGFDRDEVGDTDGVLTCFFFFVCVPLFCFKFLLGIYNSRTVEARPNVSVRKHNMTIYCKVKVNSKLSWNLNTGCKWVISFVLPPLIQRLLASSLVKHIICANSEWNVAGNLEETFSCHYSDTPGIAIATGYFSTLKMK
jgi:hypothetical protein